MLFINTHVKLLHTSLQIPTDNGKYIFVHILYTRSVISQQFCLLQCNSSKICPKLSTIQKNFKHTLSWLPSALDTSRCMGRGGGGAANYVHVTVLEQKTTKPSLHGAKSVRWYHTSNTLCMNTTRQFLLITFHNFYN